MHATIGKDFHYPQRSRASLSNQSSASLLDNAAVYPPPWMYQAPCSVHSHGDSTSWELFLFPSPDDKAEAQRGEATCLHHSVKEVVELGLEPTWSLCLADLTPELHVSQTPVVLLSPRVLFIVVNHPDYLVNIVLELASLFLYNPFTEI